MWIIEYNPAPQLRQIIQVRWKAWLHSWGTGVVICGSWVYVVHVLFGLAAGLFLV